jgi:hypothetical protein
MSSPSESSDVEEPAGDGGLNLLRRLCAQRRRRQGWWRVGGSELVVGGREVEAWSREGMRAWTRWMGRVGGDGWFAGRSEIPGKCVLKT